MDKDLLKTLLGAVTSAAVSAVLGRLFLKKSEDTGQPKPTDTNIVVGVSILIGVAVGAYLNWNREAPVAVPSPPVLQSIQAKPNTVQKGDRVTVTVYLDRPAPRHGVAIVLSSSDPAILTVDGNTTIPDGGTSGTAYSQVVGIPTYASPIVIKAGFNDGTVQTEVNVIHGDPPRSKTAFKPPLVGNKIPVRTIEPALETFTPPSKPQLNAELVERFEEAKGQFSAEKSFWDGQKKHLQGGSIRPEITSQMFAAESAERRCTVAEQASDTASLQSCVDSLNDHLTQLKIQH